MYGKIFDSIYDGTLYGHWEAIVTMQQLIVLATPDGIIDMTPQAIAARTSIPFEIISKGLEVLSKPDPYTRTPGEDGRRIVLLDEHRPWGWRMVNHGKYMRLRNMEQKREADRARIAQKRKQNKDVAIESRMSPTQTHTQTKTNKNLPHPSGAFLKFWTAWPTSQRKQAQGRCWSIWQRSDFDQIGAVILAHVDSLKASSDWQGGYVPAPLVYLNQRRWEGAEAVRDDVLKVAMP